MQIPKFIEAAFIKAFLSKIAKDPDTQTSVLGFIAAALLACKEVDWSKVLNGDPGAIGTLVACVVVALLGWRTNKAKAVPAT
jgi:hypothetical protein